MSEPTKFSAGRGMRGLVLVLALVGAQPSTAFEMQSPDLSGMAFKLALLDARGVGESLIDFYRTRGFDPIWTGEGAEQSARRAALFEAFETASIHGLPARLYDVRPLQQQLAQIQTEADRGAVELALSQAYLRYAHDMQSGLIEPRSVDEQMVRRRPVRSDAAVLEHLVSGEPRLMMQRLAPQTAQYRGLLRAKLDLEHVVARGGWGPQVRGRKLEPGDSGDNIVALRNRLTAMGYMPRSLSSRFDAALEAGVKEFQEDHGLTVDGVAGSVTLFEINTSARDRLKSVIVALERERWMNLEGGRGDRHVLVNLTDFHARIIDDGKVTFETRSVIGHPDSDRRTPEFSDVMEHMVINPTWYVPRSIVVGEYLPLLRQDPGAVAHLDIVDNRGQTVGRGFDFAQFTDASFPFGMKQPPGPSNALGSVKFMFPNRHNIYLHDTPSQHLFVREVRAFSHGCIRLDDPHEFAHALLAVQSDHPEREFRRHLDTRQEVQVNLKTNVPVHLIYRTAFVEAKEPLQFRRDIYGRDAKVWQALANAGVALMDRSS